MHEHVRWIGLILIASMCPSARAQSSLYTWKGTAPSELLGGAVAGGGDMNGDGYDEIIVGVSGETSAGAVHVYSGATGALLHAETGVGTQHGFGKSVANAGDVDGDGRPDFIVGDPYETLGLADSGSARIYSGANGSLLRTLAGLAEASRFGGSVDGVGDVDGDGHSDVIVAAGNEHVAFQTVGSARVFSGADGSVLYAVFGAANAQIATAVAGVGDVDADGRPDFVVGSSLYSGVALDAGQATVYSGRTGAVIFNINATSAFEGLGCATSAAGDVDGDGHADVLVGASGNFSTAPGSAYIYSGRSGAVLHTFVGDSVGDRFGLSVARVGDVDLDGRPDVAISTWTKNYAKVYSGASGALLYALRLPPVGQGVGMLVGGVDDLNGDGRAELVVGKSSDPSNGFSSGMAAVIVDGVAPPVGSTLCFGDGSAASCPCGNDGQPNEGCMNSTGFGATLAAFGSTSVAQDNVFFYGAQMPANTLTILFVGTALTVPSTGVFHGDGLRCIAGTLLRISKPSANQNGEAWHGPGLKTAGGWSAGDTRYFQAFYRNTSGPCGTSFNVSSAVSMLFTP